ncbi:Carboxymuconolactone decarboxylase family protein [Roseivivax jejudonensis]|uniref:Carboxymuconolactone decarboxylase family protein n=1 Tax=Roseivivax jejudonensis TaxID=1529041 RepID=A0A1X6YXP8_9RHOB|nr:peroxidase-related enzyme [Roseivivax jejudonensis]SLN34440.1 Carboxymuconolactone decarboxylase family protein [Roseivivax jejudonensis]
MTRISLPDTIDDAPSASRPSLDGVRKTLGSVPNLFRLTANSPAALEGYLGLSGALGNGALDAATRERIALAVAQINGCAYCLAAHSYVGAHVAKLSAAEIAANRNGGSTDARADAAVRFATALVDARGRVGPAAVEAVKAAGYSDAEIVEIVAHVALNTLTNYLNEAFDTPIDFPAVSAELA